MMHSLAATARSQRCASLADNNEVQHWFAKIAADLRFPLGCYAAICELLAKEALSAMQLTRWLPQSRSLLLWSMTVRMGSSLISRSARCVVGQR